MSGIPEGRGYGGFPVSGIWLRCDVDAVASRHEAKAATGSPPMSAPHLIEDFMPTALIGVSGKALGAGVGRLFSREVVEAMSRLNARPIIFALSNPTEHHGCLPEQAYAWSEGKALLCRRRAIPTGPPRRPDVSAVAG
jgi:malic enzyme